VVGLEKNEPREKPQVPFKNNFKTCPKNNYKQLPKSFSVSNLMNDEIHEKVRIERYSSSGINFPTYKPHLKNNNNEVEKI
jgi:hypothetical protein